MLAVTEEAATAIKGLLAQTDLPEEGGLRIAIEDDPDSDGFVLQLGLSPGAEEEDETVTEHGANVFVDERASLLLHDMLLDATVRGDRVGFSIEDQAG